MFAHFVAKFNSRIADEYATNPNLDFHQYVADETGLPRNATYAGEANAKQLNLSMIFCQGPGATAEKMGMQWDWDEFENHDGEMIRYRKPGEEAREIIERYHERIPGVKELAKREKSKIERFGYILTPFGRHCRFPDRKFAYKGSGILIQASSADVNKKNWVAAEAALAPFDAHLILNTHDGYEISAPEGREKEAVAAFKAAVEDPDHHKLRVPLILNVNGYGRNWWEALQKDSA
jgi:DNA polymerase I-like protein with 3'-5' exonuclease and polymerase domains